MVRTRADLERLGFSGFAPFASLPIDGLPRGPGVYAVVRPSHEPPVFRPENPAGWFKGRNPSVDVQRLAAAWVADAEIIYIGKATPGAAGRRGLQKRLGEYQRHGAGEPVGHWGGRYIWQLADSDELLIGWLETPDRDAGDVEGELISAFVSRFGHLPFANLKRERVN